MAEAGSASRCRLSCADGGSGGSLLEEAVSDPALRGQLARLARLGRRTVAVLSPSGHVLWSSSDGDGGTGDGRTQPVTVEGFTLGRVFVASGAAGADDLLESAAHVLSERVRAESEKNALAGEILSKLQELNMLYTVSGTLARASDVAEVGRNVLALAGEALAPDWGVFIVHDPERARARVAATTGVEASPRGWQPVEPDSFTWQAMNAGEPVLVPELSDRDRERLRRDLGGAADLADCLLAVPTAIADEPMGAVMLLNRPGRRTFTSVDAKLLAALASQAAASARHLRLHEDSKELFFSTVWSLASAIDAKDAYTHGHSQRVSRYASILARELGFDEQEIERLELSAVLHDVGKIGVPEAVLNKPGRLTPAEMAIMRTHPEKGADILSSIRPMRDIVPGVRHHHERYDGQGYPDGLKSENIPLHARIILVADTFDAMTSSRPYRPALHVQAAADEISRFSGTQFDPRIAAVAVRLIQRGAMRPVEKVEDLPPPGTEEARSHEG